MVSMKGATTLLGSMNRSMNLPALQRIAMEFEKENDIMDQRQEVMDDAIDDVTGLDDEVESDEVVNQVLDEIGVDMSQLVSDKRPPLGYCLGRSLTREWNVARGDSHRPWQSEYHPRRKSRSSGWCGQHGRRPSSPVG